MRQLIFPVSISGLIFLSVGIGIGYFAGRSSVERGFKIKKGAARGRDGQATGVSSYTGPANSGGRSKKARGPRSEKGYKEGKYQTDPAEREKRLRELKTYKAKSAGELVFILNKAKDGRTSELALEALVPKILEDPKNCAQYLGAISRHGVMHRVCRELVRNGGREGAQAVLSLITDSTADIEMRGEAIHALAELPPELVNSFQNESHRKAQWALSHALAQSGREGVRELMRFMEGAADERKRHTILSSVEKVEGEEVVPLLSQALSADSSPRIRFRAAADLAQRGYYGSKAAMNALAQAQRAESDPRVRKAITDMVNKVQKKRKQ